MSRFKLCTGLQDEVNRKIVAILGIIIGIIYFIFTILLIISGTNIWLTAFEIITMIAGFLMVSIIMVLPFYQKAGTKQLSVIFASVCMILTNVAHFVNLVVITPLLKKGIDIPEYLQIGVWPSVEMAVDYLGWGLFMGLAFICSWLAIAKNNVTKKIRIMLLLSGILCFIGFFGTILINENMWYIAPMGYGVGNLFICIELLMIDRKKLLVGG